MKKMLALVLLMTFLCTAIFGSSVFSAALGDVNGDNEIDNKDVVVLFRALSGGGASSLDQAAADVNGDKSVDNKDVVALFRMVSGTVIEQIKYAKSFTVSKAISKDMVIQRNEPIRIWGWAPASEEGKYVGAEFAGLSGKAKIKNGEWMITLNALPESTTPQNIRIFGDGAEQTVKDVLIGDVYWISGQSNIAYSVQNMNSEPLVSSEAKNVEINNNMQIRLNRTWSGDFSGHTLGTNEVSKDVLNTRGWQKPKFGANAFTALGYYTAVKLYNALDKKVPIGMIEFDGNGLALHAFLPNEVRDAMKVSTKDANGVYSAAGVNPHASSFVYNLGMYSFQNLPIAGFIWYQGESDCSSQNNNCYAYADRFTAFINYIRDQHNLNNHDYPVYIVELPPIYQYKSDGKTTNQHFLDFALVRMNMGSIPSKLNNAHICSTVDLWKNKDYENNLHPYNKWEVADRMTSLILANSLNIGKLDEAEGPIFDSCTFSDDFKTVTVKFRNAGEGLKAQGGTLKGFKVATTTYGAWAEPSSVTITGKDTVKITYSKAIRKVGYNSSAGNSFPETVTLCNSAGVPCASFAYERPLK